jgi:dolichyl-phosphate-mannose-protein mannosyltransferase
MFEYHDVGVAHATHPYSSKWWEWPLDYVPVAYFYRDQRQDPSNPKQCCIYEVTSLPNPIVLWFGLFSVPFVAVLAFRLRNKAYALIVLDYVLQWVPWAGSPRITFAYHFYVNVPLICLCNAIALQHLSQWGKLAGKQGARIDGFRGRLCNNGYRGVHILLSDSFGGSHHVERMARANVD